jgi:hypothetical protein
MIIVETISDTIRIKNHSIEQVMVLLAECGLNEDVIVSIKDTGNKNCSEGNTIKGSYGK